MKKYYKDKIIRSAGYHRKSGPGCGRRKKQAVLKKESGVMCSEQKDRRVSDDIS